MRFTWAQAVPQLVFHANFVFARGYARGRHPKITIPGGIQFFHQIQYRVHHLDIGIRPVIIRPITNRIPGWKNPRKPLRRNPNVWIRFIVL